MVLFLVFISKFEQKPKHCSGVTKVDYFKQVNADWDNKA